MVCPIAWETDGDDHWLIELRCGECGAWREVRVTNEEAKAFDLTLDAQAGRIQRALDRAGPRPDRRRGLRALTVGEGTRCRR
jgi:hypothetical protein